MLVLVRRLSSPRALPYTMLALMVVGGLVFLLPHEKNMSFISRNNRQKGNFAWLRNVYSCSPHIHVAFLKTHKCASSAIQNILLRYSHTHKLTAALPEAGNYFARFLPFKKEMVSKTYLPKESADIMAVHTKWNIKEVESFMPKDTIYLTIVRDPTALFESLYTFTKMEEALELSIDEYIEQKNGTSERHIKYLGFNQMLFDFGLPHVLITNQSVVQKFVSQADNHFDLIMVSERMSESLVLLKHLLCWEYEDLVALQINARTEQHKHKLKPSSIELIKNHQQPDQYLYDYFANKFSQLVNEFGRERMKREIAKLKEAERVVLDKCDFNQIDSKDIFGSNKPWSNMVIGYKGNFSSETCRLLSMAELPLLNILRQDQFTYKTGEGLSLSAMPLGSMPLDPQGMKDIVETLKKNRIYSG